MITAFEETTGGLIVFTGIAILITFGTADVSTLIALGISSSAGFLVFDASRIFPMPMDGFHPGITDFTVVNDERFSL